VAVAGRGRGRGRIVVVLYWDSTVVARSLIIFNIECCTVVIYFVCCRGRGRGLGRGRGRGCGSIVVVLG
jgi:hypothetical protein